MKQKIFLGIWDEEEHKKWFIKAGKSKQSSRYMWRGHHFTVIRGFLGHLIINP